MAPTDLRSRNRERVRSALVTAAYDLFAERGYHAVTVTDIAARAEVGRTTFFRHFGDKQEVLFAHEHQVIDSVEQACRALPPMADTRSGLTAVRPVVVDLCRRLTADLVHPELRERLLIETPELADRANRKLALLTDTAREALMAGGTDATVATVVSSVAVACFAAGQRLSTTRGITLADAVDTAFAELC